MLEIFISVGILLGGLIAHSVAQNQHDKEIMKRCIEEVDNFEVCKEIINGTQAQH